MRQLIKQQQNKGQSVGRLKNEKDYYELFSALAKREQSMGANKRYRRNTIKEAQANARNSFNAGNGSAATDRASFLYTPQLDTVTSALSTYRAKQTGSGRMGGRFSGADIPDLDVLKSPYTARDHRLATPKRQTFSPDTDVIG